MVPTNERPGERPVGSPPSIDRRSLLTATGWLFTATSLAGCSGLGNDAPGGTRQTQPIGTSSSTLDSIGPRPAYAEWIGTAEVTESSAGDDHQFGVIRVDMSYLSGLEGGDGSLRTPAPVDEGGGELLMAPLFGLIALALVAGFGLIPYGDLGQQFLGNTDDSNHTVHAGLMIGQTLLFTGEFDTSAFEDPSGFKRIDDRGGFRLYEGVESEETFFERTGLAFAVSEEVAIFSLPETGSDSTPSTSSPTPAEDERTRGRRLVETRIAVIRGSAPRAVETNASFDWVLRSGGRDEFVIAGYGRDRLDPEVPEPSGDQRATTTAELERLGAVLEDASLFANSMTIGPESSHADVSFAAAFDSSEATPTRADLEPLVTGANESSITIEGRRVAIDARWMGLDIIDETATV